VFLEMRVPVWLLVVSIHRGYKVFGLASVWIQFLPVFGVLLPVQINLLCFRPGQSGSDQFSLLIASSVRISWFISRFRLVCVAFRAIQ